MYADGPFVTWNGTSTPRSTWRLRRSWHAFILLLLSMVLMAGCARLTDTVQVPAGTSYALYGSRNLSQTFVCHHAGLEGIGVLLRPGDGELVLHLRRNADDPSDLAVVTLTPAPAAEAAYYEFPLPVQDDVNGDSFVLVLEAPTATAGAPVEVPYVLDPAVPFELILDDDPPAAGHISFQLHYDSLYIVKDLARQVSSFGLRAGWLLFLSALFYLLPGGAMVVWLLREGDWIERIVAALALSVVVYTLLVYATMTGLWVNQGVLLVLLAICAALIGVRWWLNWRQGRRIVPLPGILWASLRRNAAYPAFVLVALVVALVRIWVTRDMVAPRWGDSYHHTIIVQLLIDHGGLFQSWAPYAPYTGLTTHFGFHANAALFHWFSGLEPMQTVIWVGQVQNVLAVLALYPLGRRVGGRWAGVWAVLVGGLLSATPMVYLNWGRYPQLAGQVVLPVAGWLMWRLLGRHRLDWRLVVLSGVAAAGQVLAYYRMPYYYVLLIGALLLCVYVPRFGLSWRRWLVPALHLATVGMLSVLLLLPWGLHVARGSLASALSSPISQQELAAFLWLDYGQWWAVGQQVAWPLLLLAGLALIYALFRKKDRVLAIGLWAGGLFVLPAFALFGVPGATSLNVFASMIFIYAPVSLLVGWLGSQIWRLLRAGHRVGRWSYAGVFLLVTLYGAYRSPAFSDPTYSLVLPPDLEAMAWIRTHAPADARFLVNGFLIYNDSTIVGSDAGWWIPYLAQRENTMPPQYALLTEREDVPGYGERLVDLVADLQKAPLSTPEGLQRMCEQGLTHVYIGQGQGRVGKPTPRPLFTAQELDSHPAFEVLYHQNEVWIFELKQAACRP